MNGVGMESLYAATLFGVGRTMPAPGTGKEKGPQRKILLRAFKSSKSMKIRLRQRLLRRP